MPEKLSTDQITDLSVPAEMLEETLKALGAGTKNIERLPNLKVQLAKKDDQNRRVPEGHFFLKHPQIEPAYAPKVVFRPLSMLYQWIDYDQETNSVKNKTILVPNFQEEPRDQLGTIRCGKPSSKIFRDLPKYEQKKYSTIRCFRQLRGVVSFTGTTADKQKVEFDREPCILLLKGSNFIPFDNQVVNTLPASRLFHEFNVTLEAEEMINGAVTYYVIKFIPDYAKPLVFDPETVKTMTMFKDMIQLENVSIETQHQNNLAKNQGKQYGTKIDKEEQVLTAKIINPHGETEEDYDDDSLDDDFDN